MMEDVEDGELEMITVLHIEGGRALVQLPDASEEDWSLASLPAGVAAGDRVGVRVTGGDLEMELLPRVNGLRA